MIENWTDQLEEGKPCQQSEGTQEAMPDSSTYMHPLQKLKIAAIK